MKIIAFYLPQFHSIPENDEWWGEGFTEWTNEKKAMPLFEGHNQPRIPLKENYYNLLEDSIKEWQVDLANKYGIYGFCVYHYWFNGKLLLEKPMEQFLKNKSLQTHFCFCWANEHWTNAWEAGGSTKTLIAQKYGRQKEWEEHFNYFLPFFCDERYIKNKNRPLLVIYRPELIDCLNEMLEFWNKKAIMNGFSGIDFAYQCASFSVASNSDESHFTYAIEYQPNCIQVFNDMKHYPQLKRIKKRILTLFENRLKIDLREKRKEMQGLKRYNYDEIWENILQMAPRNDKCIPGAFVDWDNTPRRGSLGFVVEGATPEKFEKYMVRQIFHARETYKKDMIFVFSWNEWAEGGYLEPDEKNGLGYLQAIYRALKITGEV